MQKIRFITDSACDIPNDVAQSLGILVLPIPITFEDREYRERVDFTDEQFYSLLLGSPQIPTTSHLTMNVYLEEYRKAVKEGYDHIINVTINSKGSSMYNAALYAKQVYLEEAEESGAHVEIEVIDSRTYTIAYGLAVMKAAKMADGGALFREIADYLKDWFSRAEILCSVYSLTHIKKSGRVSVAAAFVGELLGLRPVILFRDGEPRIVDKVRGDRNVVVGVLKQFRLRADHPREYLCGIVRGVMPEEAEQLRECIRRELQVDSLPIYNVGASVAINCGPEVIAVVYAGKKRDSSGT